MRTFTRGRTTLAGATVERTTMSRTMARAVTVVVCACLCLAFAASAHAATSSFIATELLGKPTDTSVAVKVVPASAIQFAFQYGTSPGDYSLQTGPYNATAGQPAEAALQALSPNTKYYYRMIYDADGSITDGDFETRAGHSFWTQRAEGGTFTFDVTSDGHVGIQIGNEANWQTTLDNVAADNPDFLIELGDSIAMDAGSGGSISRGDTAAAEQVYKDALAEFNRVSASAPVFLLPGNHEQQEAWHLTAPLSTSLPIMGKNAEKKFFLNPVPGAFYSGDTRTIAELSGDHLVQDYYAWEWGDALFVVINPFWTTTTKPYTTAVGGGEDDTTGSGDRWDWTLGEDQFNWLTSTLANSNSKYKFVFSHEITGSNGMTSPDMVNYGHGGLDAANFAEWGGYNTDGSTWAWSSERPGWGSQPIRQMMEANGVTAFFHGHDHQMAYETLNGMVYQAAPSASFSGSFGNFTTGDTFALGASSGQTVWADSTEGPGRLKVTVGPDEATVDFIRYNQTTPAYSYTMAPHADATVDPDGMPSSGTAAANATSISFSHTTGTGDDGLLMAGVSWNCGTNDRSITSATFTPSGQSAIPLTEEITETTASNPRHSAVYSLLDPPKGVTGTVSFTFSDQVSNGIVAGAANFAGVDQGDPFDTADGASSTSGDHPTVTLTGLDGDEVVFDNVFLGGSSSSQTLTNGAGQTGLWNAFSSNTRAAASTKQATGDSVTMAWDGDSAAYWAIAAVPINPALATDISGVTVAAIPNQTYTGSPITPGLTVTLGSTTLVKDADYTVSYSNNVNAGTATVTITGVGSFSGTKQATFTILKATPTVTIWPSAASITLGQALSASRLTGGAASTPGTFVFTDPSKVPLVAGEYLAPVTFVPTDSADYNFVSSTVKVDVVGQVAAPSKSIASATIAAIPDQVCTGFAIAPAVKVTVGTETLVAGTDYTLTYEDNLKAGKARVIVVGAGSYTGAKTATFNIVPKKSAVAKLKVGVRKATVSWKKHSGSSGYQVAYSKKKTRSFKYAAATSRSYKTITKLKKGVRYYFKLRAYKTIDGKRYYGKWSATKSIRVK
ncbi:MAG TPA: metallophosphoesterase [Coriobacteriia bacterium]|nr:metallophosphoesterase [Coriobacteriia bacterium]